MTWRVEFLSGDVEAELRALPADMQAKFLRIAELIQGRGLERVGQPYVRHVEEKCA